MQTSFLKYVAEGRIVRRQSDLQRYTYQEICERIYLSFLTLALLKNFSQTSTWARKYAKYTLTYGDFNRVRMSANDLHNMLAVVDGDKGIVQKLANKQQAEALRQRNVLPTMATKRYLRTLQKDYEFLTSLESSLAISNPDYRNLRRAISDYQSLNRTRKMAVNTRLLQALRAKMSGTDLAKKAEEFSQKQKLELDNVIDVEREVGSTDVTPQELNAYRMLVGPANVRRAKQAYILASQGKGLPGPLTAAYLPIMKMIDDIAQGGFTFVSLLKSIHDRSKKANKK